MIEYEKSSGNIFKDLGLENPELLKFKSELVYYVMQLKIDLNTLGLSKAKLRALQNGHGSKFTVDELWGILESNGHVPEVEGLRNV